MQAPQRRLPAPRLWLAALALPLFLSGCLKDFAYPAQATQTMTFHNDGRVEMRYEGRFEDLYEQLVQAQAFIRAHPPKNPEPDLGHEGAYLPSRPDFKRQMLASINNRDAATRMQLRPDDSYTLRHHQNVAWLDELNVRYSPLSERVLFLSVPQSHGANAIGHGMHQAAQALVNPDPQNGHEADADPADAQTSAFITRMAEDVRRGMRGTLIIRTDGWMLQHNAHSVRQLPSGMHEYTWNVTGANLGDIRWELVTGSMAEREEALLRTAQTRQACERLEQGSNTYKECLLKTAPLGTACKDVIGSECKCGPFVLRLFDGKPAAHMPYAMQHPNGQTLGCADADGRIPAVISEITGACTITALSMAEKDRCINGKPPPHLKTRVSGD